MTENETPPPGTRRWVKLFGIITLLVAVAVVVLTSPGGAGTGRVATASGT